MADVVNMILSGLVVGSVYALVGLGYNVVYGATRVFNLAQGDFLMLGMMLALGLYGTAALPFPVALVLVLVIVGAVGAVQQLVAVRPLGRAQGALGWVLTTLAFGIILRGIAEIVWGTEPLRFPDLLPTAPSFIAGVRLVPQEIAIVALTLAVAAALDRFYRGTMTGKALRAMAQDPDAAALRGVPVARMNLLAFGLGAAVAALGGIMIAPVSFAYVYVGTLYTFKGFIAVAIGGIGDNRGAILGGLSLGLVEVIGAQVAGAGYRNAIALVFLLVVLLAFPRGLFGTAQVRQV